MIDFNIFQQVVGPMSDNKLQLYGDYAASVQDNIVKTPLQGLSALASGSVTHADGCNDMNCAMYNASLVRRVVSGVNLVVVCLGTGKVYQSVF